MRLLTAMALLLATTPVLGAEFFNNSQLRESCDHQPDLTSGYVAGWMDKLTADTFVMTATIQTRANDKTLRSVEKKMRANVCMRDSVTVTQATEVFCTYLNKDPAARRQSPGDALASALSRTWPCP